MKKLILSLVGMFIFGIASAQEDGQAGVERTTTTTTTITTSRVRTTGKKANAFSKPEPVPASSEFGDPVPGQVLEETSVTTSVPAAGAKNTTRSATVTSTSSNLSRPSSTSGTLSGDSGQGMRTTTTTNTP